MSLAGDLFRSAAGMGQDSSEHAAGSWLWLSAVGNASANIGKSQSANVAIYVEQLVKLKAAGVPDTDPLVVTLRKYVDDEGARATRGEDRIDKVKPPSQGLSFLMQ